MRPAVAAANHPQSSCAIMPLHSFDDGGGEQRVDGMMVDEDILKRLSGEIVKVSQARWDQNSLPPDFRPLQIAGDLPCNRPDPLGGSAVFRANPDSSMACAAGGPAMAAAPAAGSLNLSQGIESCTPV